MYNLLERTEVILNFKVNADIVVQHNSHTMEPYIIIISSECIAQ